MEEMYEKLAQTYDGDTRDAVLYLFLYKAICRTAGFQCNRKAEQGLLQEIQQKQTVQERTGVKCRNNAINKPNKIMYKDHLPHGVSACRFLLTALCILLFAGNLQGSRRRGVHAEEDFCTGHQRKHRTSSGQISKLADIRFFYNYSVLDFSRKIPR